MSITLVLPHPLSRYLAGGVETGFRKVEKDKYEPRLLHVKGRRNIRVQQVMEDKGLGWHVTATHNLVIMNTLIFYIE